MKSFLKGAKRTVALLLCLAITVGMTCSFTFGKKVTLSGKENVLKIKNNYAALAADYLEKITSIKAPCEKIKLRKMIVNELIAAGYSEDQIELQKVMGYGVVPGKNIILTVKGKNTGKQIVVGGHYDGSGAGDNFSGVALMLAEAVGLAKQKPDHTVKYVFFDEEEIGCLGSKAFVDSMSDKEKKSTIFMVNIDSIAFGDYVCIYGGKQDNEKQKVTQTSGYDLAMKYAKQLGFNTYKTKDLDGYYAKHGKGPKLDPKGVFTNPWTFKNPSPENMSAASPSTIPASDHINFVNENIPYIYFEATNWFATGKKINASSYTGYYETTDTSIGKEGMFMNTRYDTIENLEKYFPGRVMEHYNIYSPLLSKLILEPVAK